MVALELVTSDNVTIGARPMESIKKRRLAAGLTQVDVAKKCGVSVVSYQRWEQGVTSPKPENLEKLKAVLGDK